MQTYCPNCGALMVYKSEKPNFCHKCGLNLGNDTEALAAEDSREENISVPNLDKLDVEIETEKSRSIKLGDLMAAALERADNPEDDYQRPKTNKQEVLDNVNKEGSALRQRNNESDSKK